MFPVSSFIRHFLFSPFPKMINSKFQHCNPERKGSPVRPPFTHIPKLPLITRSISFNKLLF